MRYPVVLLDVGDTLLGPREPFGATYARVLRGLGTDVEPATLDAALRDAVRELAAETPPGVDRYRRLPGGEAEYWLRVVERVLALAAPGFGGDGLAARALEPLRDAFKEPAAWDVFPDVVPTLEALRGRGVRLAVVSNWDSRLPELLRRLGLSGFFEVVGGSHAEGVEKPDPRLFAAVLERLGARPETALHVGDVPEIDLAGAQRAGIDCVLVDRRGRLEAAHRALPDLWSLPGIVERGLTTRGA